MYYIRVERSLSEEKKEELVPLVSVWVITYNHEKYIRQCLDGIFMQKVDFPYEILTHDDASPDGTADIIREYEAKYPGIIRPIYQTENQYSKVGFSAISRFNSERTRGKYIALCEGDDYWTDPGKLQMQVDFLEAHPEYVGTAHNVRCINELGEQISVDFFSEYPEHVYTLDDYKNRRLPGQLASFVFKNIYSDMDEDLKDKYYNCKANGDEKLCFLCSSHGPIYCFSNSMSVYRRVTGEGTSWNARTNGKNMEYFFYKQRKELSIFAKNVCGVELGWVEINYFSIYRALKTFLSHPNKDNRDVLLLIWKDMEDKSKCIIFFSKKIPSYILRLVQKNPTK